ncbi:MAG: hypothetical protein NW200_10530 [Hyphomonadaceae bacterium]|nr:hypothetical protein [Hyphomonadaceae bacterium]
MIRALALALGLACLFPVVEAPAAAPKAEEGDSARAMDVLNLVVPVVRDGRLVNYVFVNARVHLAPGVDLWGTRDKGHFLRDALIKAVHRRSIVAPDRDDQVDPAATQALISGVARQTLGANAVRTVEILSVSSLRPGRAGRS